MKIGVLTSIGEMYLIITNRKMEDDEIEDFVCTVVEESAGNLNWQKLTEKHDGTLNFKVLEVD